jgi:DNA repair protein RadD
MRKELRPYQKDVVNKLKAKLRETINPLLVTASVGAGKSLIISEILLWMESHNYKSLCLTLNSTLIQQNADTHKGQGGNCGIYCASLNSKNTKELVVFASPHSVCQGIKDGKEIGHQQFNLIVIDEAHNVSPHSDDTMYQRIINHYGCLAQTERYNFRVIGLTGTPYRKKAISIVGDNAFFKEEVCNISSSWLVSAGYLVKPYFGTTDVDNINFKECRVQNNGSFRNEDLSRAIKKDERLTALIMREIQFKMNQNKNGVFIFAATNEHCFECAKSLPADKTAIIIGKTKDHERADIIRRARAGEIKYLVSCNCLLTGVDVPNFDVIAWLRPTESLVIYTQGIGRGLRLYPGKRTCLILDFAGNLERHGHIDDPIINEALQPKKENEDEYVIPCYTCETRNTVFSRRCRGVFNGARCNYYFEWKDCPSCGEKNDITARECRNCDRELIDPNKKLSFPSPDITLPVYSAKYHVTMVPVSGCAIIHGEYKTDEGPIFESYFTTSEKSKNVFYAKFVKQHVPTPSKYYKTLHSPSVMKSLIQNQEFRIPTHIICKKDIYGRFSISKKLFKPVEGFDN